MNEFWAPPDLEHLRRERARARDLRSSQWWKRRIETGVCHYCRTNVGRRALTMDHVVPLGRGGRSIRGNVVPACKACNNLKKSLVPVEWQTYLDHLQEGAHD
jgi:5-methylcytosine-specific restriction protein A